MKSITKDELLRAKNVRYWEIVSHWAVVIMLLVLPLFIDNTLYVAITEAKWHSFMALAIAYIAACVIGVPLVLGSKESRSLRLKDGRQKLSYSQIILLVFFALSCVSALLSEYGKDCFIGQSRYEGLVSLFLYIGVFFCLSFWGEYSEKFFYIVSATSIVIAMFAIPQLFGAELFYPGGYTYYNSLFLATIGNIDCVSGVIACAVPVLFCSYVLLEGKYRPVFLVGVFGLTYVQFAIGVDAGKLGLLCSFAIALPFLVDKKKKAFRTLQAFGVVVFSLGFRRLFDFAADDAGSPNVTSHFSASSAIFMLLGIAMLVLGIMYEKKCFKKVQKGKKLYLVEDSFKLEAALIRKYAFITMGACVVIAFVFLFVYSGENALLHELHEATHLRLADDAGSGRGIVYKNCIKLIAENPWFGTGPGTFYSAYYPYNQDIVFDFAHCDLLQIAVCQGVLALIAYVAFIVVIAARALKNAHRFYPLVIMGASMVGYLLYSFFTFSIAIVSPTFWIMAGVLDKTVRQLPKEEVATEEA